MEDYEVHKLYYFLHQLKHFCSRLLIFFKYFVRQRKHTLYIWVKSWKKFSWPRDQKKMTEEFLVSSVNVKIIDASYFEIRLLLLCCISWDQFH